MRVSVKIVMSVMALLTATVSLGQDEKIAVDAEGAIIGYKFIHFGKMMEFIKKGDDPATAMDKARGSYGRTTEEDGAVKLIDPRKE